MNLKKDFTCFGDEKGNNEKCCRYQDKIGMPNYITIDFDTLENGDVSVHDHDMLKQEKVKIEDLLEFYYKKNKN